MIFKTEDYENIIKMLEENKQDRKTILKKIIKGLKSSNDNEELEANIFNVNDALIWNGYNMKFDNFDNEVEFDNEEYYELVHNASKSLNKTIELIKYLDYTNSLRISLMSLDKLKIKYLVDLELLPNDNEVINNNLNEKFYDLYFKNYLNIEFRTILEEVFPYIGIRFYDTHQERFRIDMEYLLYSIHFVDDSKTYKKINTIKVALDICPKDYFIYEDKVHYDTKIDKNLKSYLKLLNKEIIEMLKQKYIEEIDYIMDSGYKLLFNLI